MDKSIHVYVLIRDVLDQKKIKLYQDRDQRLNPRLHDRHNFVNFQVMFLFIINPFIIVILISCNTKRKTNNN
jgi:hypothetical protein